MRIFGCNLLYCAFVKNIRFVKSKKRDNKLNCFLFAPCWFYERFPICRDLSNTWWAAESWAGSISAGGEQSRGPTQGGSRLSLSCPLFSCLLPSSSLLAPTGVQQQYLPPLWATTLQVAAGGTILCSSAAHYSGSQVPAPHPQPPDCPVLGSGRTKKLKDSQKKKMYLT